MKSLEMFNVLNMTYEGKNICKISLKSFISFISLCDILHNGASWALPDKLLSSQTTETVQSNDIAL